MMFISLAEYPALGSKEHLIIQVEQIGDDVSIELRGPIWPLLDLCEEAGLKLERLDGGSRRHWGPQASGPALAVLRSVYEFAGAMMHTLQIGAGVPSGLRQEILSLRLAGTCAVSPCISCLTQKLRALLVQVGL